MKTYYTYKCAFCGQTFKSLYRERKYCSLSCAGKAQHGPRKQGDVIRLKKEKDKDSYNRRKERLAMLERLRKRDEEYERNFPDAKPREAQWTFSSQTAQSLNENFRRFF